MAIADQHSRVSVVIPAYNAQSTIDETLQSARNQSHRDLEIIVVDDGSTDSTIDIIRRHAREDSRMVVLHQENAGVAAARNAAAAKASGAFIAPLDADDLWHPCKIERQLELFALGDAQVGLVYTRFALIDAADRVQQLGQLPLFRGEVLADLAHYNFVGTGSSPLIRRSAFEATAGYDSSLRARGGQGCEDWKLYFELAENHHFDVVSAPLTGYRMLPHNMSSDVVQMLRSRDLAIADLVVRHPELADEFRKGRNRLSRFLLHRAIRHGRFDQVASLIESIGRHDPAFLRQTLLQLPFSFAKRITGRLLGANGYYGPQLLTYAELCSSPADIGSTFVRCDAPEQLVASAVARSEGHR